MAEDSRCAKPFDSFHALIGSLTKGNASPYVAGYDDHDYAAAKDAITQATESDRAEARTMISGSLTAAIEAIPFPDDDKTRLQRLVDTIPQAMVDFCWSVVVAMDLGAARRGVPAPSLPNEELTVDQRRAVDSIADSHMQRIYQRADQSHLKTGLIHVPGFDWLLGAGIHVFRAFTFFFFYVAQKLHLNYLLLWLPIWLIAWVGDFLTFSLPWAFFAVAAWLTRGQVPSIRENDRWYGCWCFGTSLLARLDYAKTWTTPSHRDLSREHLLLVGPVATAARGAALAEAMGQRPTPALDGPGVASPVTFGHHARWWAPRFAVLLYFPLAYLLLSNWHPGDQVAARRPRRDTGSAFSQTPPRSGQPAPSLLAGSRAAVDTRVPNMVGEWREVVLDDEGGSREACENARYSFLPNGKARFQADCTDLRDDSQSKLDTQLTWSWRGSNFVFALDPHNVWECAPLATRPALKAVAVQRGCAYFVENLASILVWLEESGPMHRELRRWARGPAASQPPTPGTAVSSPGGQGDIPCSKARDPANGEPLTAALKLSSKKAEKPTDTVWFRQAVDKARQATQIDPGCAEAWSVLGFATYRAAYDICGRGDYASAEQAARKALELGTDPEVRASAARNLGRVASARNHWDEAERIFAEVRVSNPDNKEAKSWSDELAVRKNVRQELFAAVTKALSGEMLTDDDIKSLTAEELGFLINAPLARHGRRLNTGAQDWFYYCEGSPLQNRPAFDPNASRDVAKKGTPDLENMKLVQALRKQRKAGGGAVTE